MGHYEPKFEAERDETLGIIFENVARRHQSSILDLRHLDIFINHEFRVIFT
jgi:hypothetical protein